MTFGLAVLVGVGLWQTSGGRGPAYVAVVREPVGIMGTSCRLLVVVRQSDHSIADAALAQAEAELSHVEALMSTWIDRSEISRFNAAEAHQPVPLSPATRDVLQAARVAHQATGGAFDVTCRPLIELWRQADRLPSDLAIDQARRSSDWSQIDLSQPAATKRKATTRVDLGGIAKGYAIDRAIAALREAGVAGGSVDVGGDLRCFGQPPESSTWRIQVRDPWDDGVCGVFEIAAGAVCTSGGYARFTEIANRRYGHIIDPRSGRPVDRAASVTVVAPTAQAADVWATALSVLGPEGFSKLPAGTEALLITGEEAAPQLTGNGRFPAALRR